MGFIRFLRGFLQGACARGLCQGFVSDPYTGLPRRIVDEKFLIYNGRFVDDNFSNLKKYFNLIDGMPIRKKEIPFDKKCPD